MTLLDHQAGRRFELVSRSHTDPLDYYSTAREDASRKIVSDEVMGALIDELDALRFPVFARSGRAPSRGSGVITRSLEIDRDGQVEHWAVGSGSEAEERIDFIECMNTMLELYNAAQSYQTIENDRGSDVFERTDGGGRS